MRRRTRLAIAATLAAAALSMTACGGRTDGGTPIPEQQTTTSSTPAG